MHYTEDDTLDLYDSLNNLDYWTSYTLGVNKPSWVAVSSVEEASVFMETNVDVDETDSYGYLIATMNLLPKSGSSYTYYTYTDFSIYYTLYNEYYNYNEMEIYFDELQDDYMNTIYIDLDYTYG